ncbi:MAG: DUF4340 domain-containing protein [Pirellulales bacterium]|nr:DUF4340 domain-containing protein [Pirellulales bacterium]
MTEMAKTTLFAVAAIVSLLMAFVFVPRGDTFDADEFVGERLNQFEVDDANRLKIVKFDKENLSQREFEVAQSDGLWTIPSKQDYPADAVKQMAAAATCLIDREILRVAATSASEHKALGVADPSSFRNGANAEGVGTRVVISDANDETLADMIIGKGVKDATGQHYVRNTNQDLVYVVNIDPEKLSTRFADWIEDDLLQLNPLDIRKVTIKDYSALMQRVMTLSGQIQSRVALEQRGEYDLSHDDTDSKWIADRLQKFDPEKKNLVDFQLAEDEELVEDVLRELRNGLDDLLLVDVERKPEGLSVDLKAGEGFLDTEGANNLFNRGFAPMEQNTNEEIISSEGEVLCTLQNGVEYVLRFGDLKSDSTAEEASADESTEADSPEDEEESTNIGIHRYLFIMAQFNEDMIERPELQELPALPEGISEEDLAESKAPEENTDEESAGEETAAEEADEEEPKEDSAEETGAEETSNEENPDEEEDELSLIIAERKKIEEDNQRRLNEYQEQIESGKQRVKELNQRFGDWYYVIDNKVFKKIHLGRDQLIRKKEKEETETKEDAPSGGIPGLPNLPVGSAPQN